MAAPSGASAVAFEISPFKEKVLEAKLLVKCEDAKWRTPTMVLRLLSGSSTEYCAYLTGDAIASCAGMEAGRIYKITVPPKTVKKGDAGPQKYFGMSNDVVIRFKFPVRWSLVPPTDATAFAGAAVFNFAPFSTLDQSEDGSFVDLLGRVMSVDKSPLSNSLPKQAITVSNGDFYETLEFLGQHAFMNVVEDDVIACKGLVMKTWKSSRTCSTSVLSYVVVRPDASIGKVQEKSTGESPRKKATLARNCPRMTTMNILDAIQRMKADYEVNPQGPLPTFMCSLRGHLKEITMESLESAPIYEKHGIAKVRFVADAADEHGVLKRVTVWDSAARELLKVNGTALLALWEECETATGQSEFLKTMNTSKDTDFDLTLEVVLREWQNKYSYQVNVNEALPISGA